MNLQGNVRKLLVEFGLRERPRLLAGLKWGLGGSEDFGARGLRARMCEKRPSYGLLGPNPRLPGERECINIYIYIYIYVYTRVVLSL